MNKYLDAEVIQEIAIELGVHPSFIEKDWYAVQVIKLISEHRHNDITPIFSGGTSLSKGFNLIKRFSEDIDFKITTGAPKNRSHYRQYRESIIELISQQENFEVIMESLFSADGSKFFSLNISYPQNHQLDNSLRNALKLEMHFQDNTPLYENREIQSFVSDYMNNGAETDIECIKPVETAADKFSALLWRILSRDRKQPLGFSSNDPTLVRHLHDLCALEKHLAIDEVFYTQIQKAYINDTRRGSLNSGMSIETIINDTQQLLAAEDTEYRSEYTRFVEAMSYAPDNERINYDTAISSFNKICDSVIARR